MLIWMEVWIQLCSATLLKELKAVGRALMPVAQAALRAAPAARFGAHPRLFDARSQFSLQGFGNQLGLAGALRPMTPQGLAIQDRGVRGRIGLMAGCPVVLRRVARTCGMSVRSGLSCRT